MRAREMESGIFALILILLAGIVAAHPQPALAHHVFLEDLPLQVYNVDINLDPDNPSAIESVTFQTNSINKASSAGLSVILSGHGQSEYPCVQLSGEWLCSIHKSPTLASIEHIQVVSSPTR